MCLAGWWSTPVLTKRGRLGDLQARLNRHGLMRYGVGHRGTTARSSMP
jgi:hypothetical protein